MSVSEHGLIMEAGEPAIEIEGLTRRYGEVVAVRGLDMTVEQGDSIRVFTPNGADKTTMRMLTTLTKPTAGSARVAGFDVAERGQVTEHIGYLPAEPPVFDELTGREYLRYLARLRELDTMTTEKRIELLS